MTQPGFTSLSTIYTRALRLLGFVPAQRQLQAPLAVQPVQIVADVSDVVVPHSNPVFGISRAQAAVAAERGVTILETTSRLVRIRQIEITATTPRVFVVSAATGFTITTPGADVFGVSVGPQVNVGTAIVHRGTTTTVSAAGAWSPGTNRDLRPPLLVAPGQLLVLIDSTVNIANQFDLLWEEIPTQDQVVDIGFPLASDA